MLVASRSDKEKITLDRVVHAIAATRAGVPADDMVTAALSDITKGGNPAIGSPAWLGELWSGNAHQREVIPTMSQKPLTAMTATSWRWVVKPAVSDYAGDKAEVPTNQPTTESVTVKAKRLAGAHDIDRAFFDFNDTEFITSYFQAMSESYSMLSDDKAAQFAVAEAIKNKGGKQPTLLKAAAKARQLIRLATRTEASTYLVHPDDMFALLDITEQMAPKYLDLIGVDPAKFLESNHAKKGTVVAYAKPAIEFFELKGSPIRVQAEHLSHGGRDAALFGYYATNVTNSKGVVSVEFGAA